MHTYIGSKRKFNKIQFVFKRKIKISLLKKSAYSFLTKKKINKFKHL